MKLGEIAPSQETFCIILVSPGTAYITVGNSIAQGYSINKLINLIF